MLSVILGILGTLLRLYDLLVLVWVLIELFKPRANYWTELVRALVDPVLAPIRKFLLEKLPVKWQIIDWSPIALWILSGLIQRFIAFLR